MSNASFRVCALVLLGCGLTSTAALADEDMDGRGAGSPGLEQPALPAGHVARYRLTYMHSSTATAIRSATVISITNQTPGTTCSTSVDWRIGFGGVTCTTTLVLGPGQTGEHCSRPLPVGIATCNATCNPALVNVEGSAIVGSQNIAGCNLIAVDGRLFHTTGSTDGAVAAISNPHIVRISSGNAGD